MTEESNVRPIAPGVRPLIPGQPLVDPQMQQMFDFLIQSLLGFADESGEAVAGVAIVMHGSEGGVVGCYNFGDRPMPAALSLSALIMNNDALRILECGCDASAGLHPTG